MKPRRCRSRKLDRLSREVVRCILPDGHDWQHDDGCITWCDRADVRRDPCPRCGMSRDGAQHRVD